MIEDGKKQKLRGGYYTPKDISDFLTNWAIQKKTDLVLEPSCGDGIFLESAINRFRDLGADYNKINNQLIGVELNSIESKKSINRIEKMSAKGNKIVVNDDFFNFAKNDLIGKKQFDAVIGNPPFIRYQDFIEKSRKIAFDTMKDLKLNPTRLTNIWIPFLVASSSIIKHGGRLAMVIPSELFQVNYTAETRRFLTTHFYKVTIITFKKLVFEGIQQEVVLFLGEKDGGSASFIKTIELDNLSDLKNLHIENNNEFEEKPLIHSDDKWTYYFLDNSEITFLHNIKDRLKLKLANEIIDVDVGVVTGQNKFFILSHEQILERGLKDNVEKIVTRSGHLTGIEFNKKDWDDNLKKDYPMYLLNLSSINEDKFSKNIKSYLEEGEKSGVNKGYKCRIRKKWYVVPSLWIPDAFILRQVHNYPKIVINKNKAMSTDTIHRVKILNNYKPEQVASIFLNSISLTFAELLGRSYGGGVLTFEPSECEKIPIPTKGMENLNFEQIDLLERQNKIDEILDITDKMILMKEYGLTKREVCLLRSIWKKLRNRRINRTH